MLKERERVIETHIETDKQRRRQRGGDARQSASVSTQLEHYSGGGEADGRHTSAGRPNVKGGTRR